MQPKAQIEKYIAGQPGPKRADMQALHRLFKTCGTKLGKASVTGYCIKFKALKDINAGTLEAIRDGIEATS